MADARTDSEPRPSRPKAARVPPHDLQAEESLLGAMLLSKDAIAAAAEVLTGPDDFYKPAHGHIYEAITALYSAGEPIDPVTVSDQLNRNGLLDMIGGPPVLVSLQSGTPATTSAARYAKIIEEHALLRKMIWVSSEIIESAYDVPDDVAKLLDSAESRIYEVADRRLTDTTAEIGHLLDLTLDRLEELYNRGESITGVPTGYVDLDKILAGLQPNALVVVGARPAMGKCLRGDTLLVDPATGARRTIEALAIAGQAGGDVTTLSLDDDGWLVETTPSCFVDDGVKPVYRVRTSLGREVSTTLSHPFLTADGWRPLAEITPGTEIAVPATMPVFGKEEPSELQIERRAATLSGAARVPDVVFCYARPQLARYLASVFELADAISETDHGGGYRRVSYVAATKALVCDLQHLLLRFGINARVRAHRSSYELEILAATDIDRFFDEILDSRRKKASERTSLASRTSDVLWDEVVEIIDEGDHQVYDLTIPELHNFVAADVCVHNTSFALGIASHAGLEAQRPVLLFSLEMSQLEMSQRILCAEARVDATKVRNGTLSTGEWEKIHHAVGRLANAPIYIDDNPNVTIMDIRAKARRLKSRVGDLGCIIIDYIQLMNGRSHAENRQVEVSEISRNLKILARELETPVVALAQLNRALETRADKRPMLSDLRESGCLTAATRLLRADTGAEITLGELIATDARDVPVWSLDEHWRMVPATLTHAFPSGVKQTFRLRLASGRCVEATANHRFRTIDGWVPLGTLALGSRLAVPRQLVDSKVSNPNVDLATSDVLWDTVVAIEPLGEQPVFDATVLGTHNFVANGIVAHNSLEQDSDVVLFLYRDEVYNPETPDRGTAEVIVAKHRSGPTGKVRLAWLDHYTKFANMARGV